MKPAHLQMEPADKKVISLHKIYIIRTACLYQKHRYRNVIFILTQIQYSLVLLYFETENGLLEYHSLKLREELTLQMVTKFLS